MMGHRWPEQKRMLSPAGRYPLLDDEKEYTIWATKIEVALDAQDAWNVDESQLAAWSMLKELPSTARMGRLV
jgi:hypothetical protein